MKFGKRMLREQHEPWTDAYVNYKVCFGRGDGCRAVLYLPAHARGAHDQLSCCQR
jgi:hypothetical protein